MIDCNGLGRLESWKGFMNTGERFSQEKEGTLKRETSENMVHLEDSEKFRNQECSESELRSLNSGITGIPHYIGFYYIKPAILS